MPKTIVEFLQSDYRARITFEDRWLVWSNVDAEWVIYEKRYMQKGVKCIGRTVKEDRAIQILLTGKEPKDG